MWFLPAVLVLAVIGFLTSGDVKVAVSVLLVACPCAFAIATPTAVTAGISNMARRAVLIKGGVFLELARKIDTLVMDKTGTFTFGRPKVVDVVTFDGKLENDVLQMAAIAEKYSEHPLARSVMTLAKERGIEAADPDEFNIEIGMGVKARYNGKDIFVGKEDFLRGEGILVDTEIEQIVKEQTHQGRGVILVANDKHAVGLIAIADEIRPQTHQAIASLKAMGIKKCHDAHRG